MLQRLMLEHTGEDVIGLSHVDRSGGLAEAIEQEAEAAFRDAGYAGSYSLDPGGRITFTIDEALAPNWDGRRPSASISFENDRMHFVSSAEGSPTGAFYSHLVWKRAE